MIRKILIKNEADLARLRTDWERLEKGPEMTTFQSYDWHRVLFREWHNSLYNRLLSKIYVYENIVDDEVQVILPVVDQPSGLKFFWYGREKSFFVLGEGSYSDYMNFIYSNYSKKNIVEVLDYIKAEGKTLSLTCVRGEYHVNDDLMVYRTGDRMAVQVPLPSSKEAYWQSLSKHMRQNIRTAANRLKRDKKTYRMEVKFGKIADASLLARMRAIHMKRLDDKVVLYKHDMLHRLSRWLNLQYKRLYEYYNNVVNSAAQIMPNTVLVLVYIDDELVGYLYGLQDDRAVRILQNTVDTAYAFYSPMTQGCVDFIGRMIEHPDIDVVDFTRGQDGYKYKLGGKDVQLFNYQI